MKQEIKTVIAGSKKDLPTYNWHINYTQLSDMYSIHQAGRLITIMYAENPTAKEDAELIVKAVNSFDKMAFDLQCLATDKMEWENERKALLDSHKELLEVMKLVDKKFEQWPIGNQTWDKVKTAIDNAKKIIP